MLTYFENGDIKSRQEYKNGVVDGLYERYYKHDASFVVNGGWIDDLGYVKERQVYVNGKLIETLLFTRDELEESAFNKKRHKKKGFFSKHLG